MLIDLTYRCSMGCLHCFSDCKPDGEDMSIETLKDVFKFMKKHKIQLLNFSGGEMFEHPEIMKILDIIENELDKTSIITFITNGRILSSNSDIYNKVLRLRNKYKSQLLIQVTDDERFYPTKLTEKQRYWLTKLGAIVDTVPSRSDNRNKCLYPQGRALENFNEDWWYTKAPKCTNVRIATIQGINSFEKLHFVMTMNGLLCTPVIAPDGSIKIGESALCPPVASIYDSEEEIIRKIKTCSCMKCRYSWNKLKETNNFVYELLTLNGGVVSERI